MELVRLDFNFTFDSSTSFFPIKNYALCISLRLLSSAFNSLQNVSDSRKFCSESRLNHELERIRSLLPLGQSSEGNPTKFQNNVTKIVGKHLLICDC